MDCKPMQKGERFGKLITLGEHEKRNSGYFEKCKCDCGTIKFISRNHLRRGASKSCGCGVKENSRKAMIKMNTKHGMFGTRIYAIYRGMYGRCNNPKYPNYKNYGGRGIKLLWNSFEDFYRDMGESYLEHSKEYGEGQTTIDRIDVNGNYCKDNCKWSTHGEQANNKRNTVYHVYKGDRMSLRYLCDKYNANYKLVANRLHNGWNIKDAIER